MDNKIHKTTDYGQFKFLKELVKIGILFFKKKIIKKNNEK